MSNHMFNPNFSTYNQTMMESQARKRAKRDGQTTVIHNHKADTHCQGGCIIIEPNEEPENGN